MAGGRQGNTAFYQLIRFDGMKILTQMPVFMAMLFWAAAACPLSAQEPQEPDFMEIAETEADRLQKLLDLEDWQVFYVDSTLKHDFPAMQKEMMALQTAKVSNSSMYVSVQDKWMQTIDDSYKRIFNEEQWDAYMKSGAAKALKAREKRKAKSQMAITESDKKQKKQQ